MTDKIKHAFARSSFAHEYGSDCEAQDGMELRDYFAAKAMPTLLSQLYEMAEKEGRGFDNIYKIASEASYEMADTMISAR